MKFGEAIEAMKQGKSVRSPRMGRELTSLRYVPATDEHEPFIAWILLDGTWEPMSYSHKNVLAEDWEVVEDN